MEADVDSSVNFKYGEIGQYVVIATSEYNFCVKLYRKPAAPEIEPFFASVVSSCQVTYILSNELTVDDKEITVALGNCVVGNPVSVSFTTIKG